MKTKNLKLKNQNYGKNLKDNLRYRDYQFSLAIIKSMIRSPKTISDQLLRNISSDGTNIIETSLSSSRKDFIKSHEITVKRANETEYWFSLLRDSNLIEKYGEIAVLIKENDEIIKMLASN